MNNLKFRVWCPGGKRFYYNPYIYNGEAYCWNNTETELVKWYSKGQELVHGKVIIEQFTGLKDKNGKEIYVGDIISYTPFNQQDMKGTIVKVPNLDRFHWFAELAEMLAIERQCDTTIIGNIHENPELIAVSEKLTEKV